MGRQDLLAEEEEVCDICGKPLRNEVYHIEDIVGHLSCFYKAVSAYMQRLKLTVADIEELLYTPIGQELEAGDFIEVVSSDE